MFKVGERVKWIPNGATLRVHSVNERTRMAVLTPDSGDTDAGIVVPFWEIAKVEAEVATDFTKGERVKLKHWGDTATVVALPDEVEAAEGLKGHYRIKLDDAAKGWRYVTPDKLVRVEASKLPFKVLALPELHDCIMVSIYNKSVGVGVSEHFTEAEAEALVAALQHALAELALGE